MRVAAALLLVLAPLAAQKVEFEVATIKTIAPGTRISIVRQDGGPGTKDPTTFVSENTSIAGLVSTAYEKKYFEIEAPEWMQNDRFTVTAKVAEGATKDQFREMLRNLLTDRFNLQIHRETKQMPGYVLSVAKGGPKFRESNPAPELESDSGGSAKPEKDADGYPVFPRGSRITMAIMNGKARFQYAGETLEHFALQLSYQLHGAVIDQTGLSGRYDLAVNWDARQKVPEDEERGPDLVQAVKESLGLQLREEKVPVDVIVIDHAEHTPVEN